VTWRLEMSATATAYRISGTIIDRDSGRPIMGLRVRARDKDFFRDQLLGDGDTDENGRYEIRFNRDVVDADRETSIDLRIPYFPASTEEHDGAAAPPKPAAGPPQVSVGGPPRALPLAIGVKPSARWLEASTVRTEVFASQGSRRGRSESG
jgi:hypothetical protein